MPTNGKDTRRILNEAHTVTYFPHSSSGKIKYLLEEYVGLDRKQISHMKKQHSRACTIFKNYPQCFMLEHEVGLLNLHDDSSEDEKLVKAKPSPGQASCRRNRMDMITATQAMKMAETRNCFPIILWSSDHTYVEKKLCL